MFMEFHPPRSDISWSFNLDLAAISWRQGFPEFRRFSAATLHMIEGDAAKSFNAREEANDLMLVIIPGWLQDSTKTSNRRNETSVRLEQT